MLNQAIIDGLDYCAENEIDIPLDILLGARSVGAIKAEGNMDAINARYHSAITAALIPYLEGGSMAASRNAFKRATVEAFGGAFDLGWADGGGEPPPDAEALAWFNVRVDQEIAYINSLYQQAKELRKDPEFDRLAWVTERADAYVQSAIAVYNAALMLAKGNEMLTWQFGDTEHCKTCQGLNGKRHRASWYLSRDYIPGKPGAAMACGGYRCQCKLKDKSGKVVTI